MKLFILTIFLLLFAGFKNDKINKTAEATSVKNKNLKDYIDFKYDEVIAFASVNPMDYYDGDFDKELNVKKFEDTISRKLDPSQVKSLNDILSGRKNKSPFTSVVLTDCFYPRHNIIFLKDKKVVNYISVCFECYQIKSSKHTFADMKNYEDFFNSIGLKMFNNPLEHKKHYDSLKLVNNTKFNLNKKK